MRILMIGDKHLKMSTFESSMALLRWIEEQVEVLKPDMVVDLGDTFDSHAVLRSEILAEFNRHVNNIKIPYYYVLGNHDMCSPKSRKYHALQVLSNPNLVVADDVIVRDDVIFVPYWLDLDSFPTQQCKIMFAHQTFVGADYGFCRTEDGVDARRVQADLIVSGHIHKKQTFDKVFYPGSPMATSVKDVDQVKGIHLLDTTTMNIDFIQSPFPVWHSLEVDMAEHSTIQLITEIRSRVNTKDRWVVRLRGPRKEIAEFVISKPFKALQKEFSVTVRPEPVDKIKQATSIKGTDIGNIVRTYLDSVYTGSIDKEELNKMAAEIIGS